MAVQLDRKETLKGLIGSFLLPIMPGRAKQIAEDGFTLQVTKSRNPIDALLRAGMARKLFQGDDLDTLAELHRQFWAGPEGHAYHEVNRYAFDLVYPQHFSTVDEQLQMLLAQNPSIKKLVEIGSGSGQMLAYLAEKFPEIDQFIGIDLSPETIEGCREQYKDPRLEFVVADGDKWIRELGQSDTVFFSHRGVLEYFPQQNLLSLFQYIAENLAPSIFISIEPIGIDFDLETESISRPYSHEYSFSHNYPQLMQAAGFDIRQTLDKGFEDHRLFATIATVGF